MATSTHQGQIDKGSRPAVDPVAQMLAIRPPRRPIAAGELAVPVSQDHGPAHGSGNQPRRPAYAQDLRVGPELDPGHRAVTRYTAGQLPGHRLAAHQLG